MQLHRKYNNPFSNDLEITTGVHQEKAHSNAVPINWQ
jgi:hypothetical protein